MSLNIKQTIEVLSVADVAELSVMLWGATSTGKSAAVKEYALQTGKRLVDFRLSQTDSGELLGIPQISEDGKTFTYAAPSWWPQNKTERMDNGKLREIPNSAEPIVLFLDEINRARVDLINAAFELALDRRIGGRELPKGSMVVAACNPAEDGYSTNEMDIAFLTRFLNFETILSHDEFRSYLQKQGYAPSVADFLAKEPSALNDGGNCTMPKFKAVPRGWEKIAKSEDYLKVLSPEVRIAFILAAIGMDRGLQYIKFCENCDILTGKELRNCKDGSALSKMKKMMDDSKMDMVNVTMGQLFDAITESPNSYKKTDYEIMIELCDIIPRDLLVSFVQKLVDNGNAKYNHQKYAKDGRLNQKFAEIVRR